MATNPSNDDALKRLQHNTLEKKRKDKINLGIQYLRDVLPTLSKKESAGETLNRAAKAIQDYQEYFDKHKQQEIEILDNIEKLEEELKIEKKECESYRELLKISDRIPPDTMTVSIQTDAYEPLVPTPVVISKPLTPLSMQSDPSTPATPVNVLPTSTVTMTGALQTPGLQLPMQQILVPNQAVCPKNVKQVTQNQQMTLNQQITQNQQMTQNQQIAQNQQMLIPVNQKGCRIALQNGQLVLINDAPAQLATQLGPQILNQLQTTQQTILPAPTLLQQNNNNNNNIILKNNSVTTPLFTEDANSTLKPSLASQSIRIATPTGTLTMNTRPQQPNQMPSALVLPSGQIIPVVTRPQTMYPRQCLSNSIFVSGVSAGLTSTTVTASTPLKQLPSTMSAMINNEGNIILTMPDKNSMTSVKPSPFRKVVPKQSKEEILNNFTNDLLAQATESIFSSVSPTATTHHISHTPVTYRNTANDDNPLLIVETTMTPISNQTTTTTSNSSPIESQPKPVDPQINALDDTDISDFSDLIRIPPTTPKPVETHNNVDVNDDNKKETNGINGEESTQSPLSVEMKVVEKQSPTLTTTNITPESQKYTNKDAESRNNLSMPIFEAGATTPKMSRKRKKETFTPSPDQFHCVEDNNHHDNSNNNNDEDEDDDEGGSLSDTITFNDSESDLSRVLEQVERLSPLPNTLNTPLSNKRRCFLSKESEKKRIRIQDSVFGMEASSSPSQMHSSSEGLIWPSMFDSPEKSAAAVEKAQSKKQPEVKIASPTKKDKKSPVKLKNQNVEKLTSTKNRITNDQINVSIYEKENKPINQDKKDKKQVIENNKHNNMDNNTDNIYKPKINRDICEIEQNYDKKISEIQNNHLHHHHSLESSPTKEVIDKEESEQPRKADSLQYAYQPPVISTNEVCKPPNIVTTPLPENMLQTTPCSNNDFLPVSTYQQVAVHKLQPPILNHGSPEPMRNIPPILSHPSQPMKRVDIPMTIATPTTTTHTSPNKPLKHPPPTDTLAYMNPLITQTVENVHANNPFSNDLEDNSVKAAPNSYLFDQPIWSKSNDSSSLKCSTPIGASSGYCANSELAPFSFSLTSNSITSVHSSISQQTDTPVSSRLPFYATDPIGSTVPLNLQRHYPDYAPVPPTNKTPIFPSTSFANTPWITGLGVPPLVSTSSVGPVHNFQQHVPKSTNNYGPEQKSLNITSPSSIGYPLQKVAVSPDSYATNQKMTSSNPCYLNKLPSNPSIYQRPSPSITPGGGGYQPPPPQQQRLSQQRATPSPISAYHSKSTTPVAYPAQKSTPSPQITGYNQRPSPISTPSNLGPPGPYFNAAGLPAGGLLDKSPVQHPAATIPQRAPYHMDVYPPATDTFSYISEQEKRAQLYKLPQAMLPTHTLPSVPLTKSSGPLPHHQQLPQQQPPHQQQHHQTTVKRASSKKSKSKKKTVEPDNLRQPAHFGTSAVDTKTSSASLQKDQRPTYLGGSYISALPPNATKHVEPPIHASFNGQFQHQPPHLHGMIGNSQMVPPAINHAAYPNFPALFPDISNNPLNVMSPPALKHPVPVTIPPTAGHIRHQQVAQPPAYPPAGTFHPAAPGYPAFYPPGGCFPPADIPRFAAPHHHSTHPSFTHFPALHDH